MSDIRSIKTKQVTLLSHLTTTNLGATTTIYGDVIDTTGYMTGVFVVNVIANTTGDPAVYLDASVDSGTTYIQYATLHPDMTTTANLATANVDYMPNTVRVRVQPFTTSSNMRLTVKAEIFAK